MTSQIPPILLVGCGRMGSAMLAGWRERGLAPSFAVDPSPAAASVAGPVAGVLPPHAAMTTANSRLRAHGVPDATILMADNFSPCASADAPPSVPVAAKIKPANKTPVAAAVRNFRIQFILFFIFIFCDFLNIKLSKSRKNVVVKELEIPLLIPYLKKECKGRAHRSRPCFF